MKIGKYVFVTGLIEGKYLKGQYVLRNREYVLLPLYPLIYLWGVFLYWRAKFKERKRMKMAHYTYQLAGVAIAKNESKYIAEWLAFHKLQGVEVVFLYDNDSTDNMCDILEPFIADGFVIYNKIHGKAKQYEAYCDGINRYGHLCKYMAFIDCDEFLLPMNSHDHLLDLVDALFEKDENIGGVVVNWCIYGSSGHEKRHSGLVIDNFTSHATVGFEWNEYVKSIVKPSSVQYFAHAHYPRYKYGFYPINNLGKFAPTCWNAFSDYGGFRLNHYICKSMEEWAGRRKYAGGDGLVRSNEEFYIFDRNDVHDSMDTEVVEEVKRVMTQYT